MPSPAPYAALVLALLPAAAGAASFDCARARAPTARAVCADATLSNLDSRLVGLLDLDEGTVAMGQRGSLQDEQSAWIRTRDACGANRTCLAARYRQRLAQVKAHLVQRLCGQAGPPC